MPGRSRTRPARRALPPRAPIPESPAQSVIDARSSQAWRAVRQFTKMLPTFTSFARMATGNNKVTVRLGNQGAATDGTTIWIFPPIALGDERVHDRSKCDRRGPDKRQTCKACDAREVSLFYLFHEIAHIAFDSAVQPLDYLVDRVEGMIDDWHPKEACNHSFPMRVALRNASGYMELGAAHNGFLPIIINALEDARVNARMFRARPGLRVMFEAGTQRVFEAGVELPDGTKVLWRDQKPNPAVIIGLFLLASGTPVEEGFFSEQVTEALSDPGLARICSRVVIANSAHQIMELSIEAFRRLNEMGYCLVPKCEVQPSLNKAPQPDDEETNGANQSTDDEPDDSSGSPSSTGDGSEGEPEDGTDAGQQQEADSGDAEDSDGGPTGSDGGGDERPEGEQSSSNTEDADSSGSDGPDSVDTDAGESGDDEPEDGSGDRSSDPAQAGDNSVGEDPTSADESARGADDEHDSPEGEDGSEPGQSAGGAGNHDDGDDQDSSELAPSSGAGAEGDDSDGTEEDGAASQGKQSPGDEASESTEEEDSTAPDDLEGDGPADVSESVWDDPTNSEATQHQYDNSDLDSGTPDYGSPEDVAGLVEMFGAHRKADPHADVEDTLNHEHFGDEDHSHESPHERMRREGEERMMVEFAARQSGVFDTSSRTMDTLEVHKYPVPTIKWDNRFDSSEPKEFFASEGVMGHAVMQARLAFEDNKRSKETRHLKSGRLDSSVLGRRAPTGDPRLFAKKLRPAKKNYFFVIGVDCSGSTSFGGRNARIKRAVFAQANLLHRLGFGFAIYGMTGGVDIRDMYSRTYGDRDTVWVLSVKEPEEPWSPAVQQRLADLRPVADNFDGHNIEFLRKVLDRRTETNRGVIYYTDGDMPAANADEEIVILNNEIATCRRLGYGLLAVGINTDSPRQYGLDTVQVDSDADIVKVVEQLGRNIAHS